MNIKDKLQKEWSELIKQFKEGLYLLAPRTGKIRTTFLAIEDSKQTVLVVYPNVDIKQSWLNDSIRWKYDISTWKFSTTNSLNKVDFKPDILILDEIQDFSIQELLEAKKIYQNSNCKLIVLTGTLAERTKKRLKENFDIPIRVTYTIEQAVKDGVVTDYEINVVYTQLDNTLPIYTRFGKKVTELIEYNNLSNWMQKLKDEGNTGKTLMFASLKRQRLFKDSIAKLYLTKSLIRQFSNERLLVFCGVTKIADKLGIPVYHSKNKDIKLKNDFLVGKIQHLATINMLQAGITVTPINKCIINFFDSNPNNLTQRINRIMCMEYNNPSKKAVVYIVCTKGTIEEKWLQDSLSFFDDNKINYIN